MLLSAHSTHATPVQQVQRFILVARRRAATYAREGAGGDARVQLQTIDPFLVRFSQESIRSRFKTGKTIDDLVENLRAGRVEPLVVSPIRVVERNGLLFTLDNRRLEAFRRT
jgi:hypothetical protein